MSLALMTSSAGPWHGAIHAILEVLPKKTAKANYALSISGFESAVFLREMPEERIRVSLRSKGKVNVAEVAERSDGGGRENAPAARSRTRSGKPRKRSSTRHVRRPRPLESRGEK